MSRTGSAVLSILPPASPPLPTSALLDMATGLARAAGAWSFEVAGDDRCRSGLKVLATETYNAWILRWPPGTSVEPHDHGDSAGAFAVVSGELTEIRWEGGDRSAGRVRAGDAVPVARGVIHDVIAESRPALSVHVYSPPLRSMTFFDPSGQVALRRTPVDDEPAAASTARLFHPSGRV